MSGFTFALYCNCPVAVPVQEKTADGRTGGVFDGICMGAEALLSEMAMPYAIADSEGHLIWMNSAFRAVVKEDKRRRKSLTAIFPDITKEILEDMEERSSIHSSLTGNFTGLISGRFIWMRMRA